MRRLALCGVLMLLASPMAVAEPLTIDLPGPVQRAFAAYGCSDGTPRRVEYLNLPGNSLALLSVEGGPRLFAGTLAGSGARYASGPYVWWTKGGEASLYDETRGEAPLATCTEKVDRP